jgi:peptidoglycan/xylan/chitin deacetylase (PgdA/CDA1 family)
VVIHTVRLAAVGALAGGLIVGGCSSDHKVAGGPKHKVVHKAVVPAVDCRISKCIALTFDDGPDPGTTKLLDTLKANHAKATFFVLGSQVATNADILKREVAEGNEVGNHTYTHMKLAGAPEAKVQEEIGKTQDAIKLVLGISPVLFRPTYGATDKQLDAVTKQDNLAQILWTVDTDDWRDHNSALIEKRVLKGAKPGHIILMHDVRPTTVAAVPNIIKKLAAQGYKFVTVSELYGGKLASGEKFPPFLGSPTAGPAPAGA